MPSMIDPPETTRIASGLLVRPVPSPATPTSIATAPIAISANELRRLCPSHVDGPWMANWRCSSAMVLRTRALIAMPNIVIRLAKSSTPAQPASGTISAAKRRLQGCEDRHRQEFPADVGHKTMTLGGRPTFRVALLQVVF